MSTRLFQIRTNGGSLSLLRCAHAKTNRFYHLLAENEETEYIAYVSEQNLLPDTSEEPVRHPQVDEIFGSFDGARYAVRVNNTH